MRPERLRILHAIHDFLPRHRAGSEIYAAALAREQLQRHDVFVLAAEYDPADRHGTLRWRGFDGLVVVEVINNWEFSGFDEAYASARLDRQVGHVLQALCPDVVHVHSLQNLTLSLPGLARQRGAAVAATLHDYTLVCPSGGQRLHAAENHVCEEIDPARCARCFAASPWAAQLRGGRLTSRPGGRLVGTLAAAARRRVPALVNAAASRLPAVSIEAGQIEARLARARQVFDEIACFVAPSQALADEFVRLGVPARRMAVSPNGHRLQPRVTRRPSVDGLRIGFVGTIIRHKGVHVLIEAARRLTGRFTVEIAGDENVAPDYAAELRGMARDLPIRFTGPFERDRLPAVYAGIDVLVVPSIWPENSPLVVQEAFHHGAAVVASRIGGLPQVVREGSGGRLFPPGSAASLASVLQWFVDNPLRATELASRAPAVRSIAADADEWDRRYAAIVTEARRSAH
jgi:glycosyltransferase involved in cell wall biosynthesis